jgi:hypothetical protein
MGHLRINKLIYSGKLYYFESPHFDRNIIILEGDNGCGKTTFCNLIYFGLGGNVPSFKRNAKKEKHREITSDIDNYVDLYVSISGEKFLFRRFIDENEIMVTPYREIYTDDPENKNNKILCFEHDAELSSIFRINRSENHPETFSDWLLNKLDFVAVELFYGTSTFRVNFNDLFRLIYHNQQPDPINIYKKIDNDSTLVSDSEFVRKVIFELLIGKSFADLYLSVLKEKSLFKDRAIAKSLLDEYKKIADGVRENEDQKNIVFLKNEIDEKQQQLRKLHNKRKAIQESRSKSNNVSSEVDLIKDKLISIEFNLSFSKEALIGLLKEKSDLIKLSTDTKDEISKIKKIIFSHENLNLFNPDTCPYCLSKVERHPGHCVCGSSVDENQYERFFYTSHEYKDILNTKIKSLSTIELALIGCNEEIHRNKEHIELLENNIIDFRNQMMENIQNIESNIDIESLNKIDNAILDTKEKISRLSQLLSIEDKLNELQVNFDSIHEQYTGAELDRKAQEIKAKKDIYESVKDFSKIYNELLLDTLPSCRSAKIDINNYLPIIDDGAYREASAKVSVRLMYFLGLLHMSLKDDVVHYPRFLLVDTPETAGIEPDELIHCIEKFSELDSYKKDYQVIIATGIGKYPSNMLDNRLIFMPDKSLERLLKERS